MGDAAEVPDVPAEFEISEKVMTRLHLAEEEFEGLDSDKFVEQSIKEKLQDLEEEKGKIIAYGVKAWHYDK